MAVSAHFFRVRFSHTGNSEFTKELISFRRTKMRINYNYKLAANFGASILLLLLVHVRTFIVYNLELLSISP